MGTFNVTRTTNSFPQLTGVSGDMGVLRSGFEQLWNKVNKLESQVNSQQQQLINSYCYTENYDVLVIDRGVVKKKKFNLDSISGGSGSSGVVTLPITFSTLLSTPTTPLPNSAVLFCDSSNNTLCIRYSDGSVWEITMNPRVSP